MTFGNLAGSFDPKRKTTPANPALRLHGYTKGTDNYINAHKGAELMARGCVKAIRNLHAHRADVPISPNREGETWYTERGPGPTLRQGQNG